MEIQYLISDIYFGIRNDYYVDNKLLNKFKIRRVRHYDAFIKTDKGFMSITNNKYYEGFYDRVLKKGNYACELEPAIFFFDKDNFPYTLTVSEIKNCIKEKYLPTYKKYNKVKKVKKISRKKP